MVVRAEQAITRRRALALSGAAVAGGALLVAGCGGSGGVAASTATTGGVPRRGGTLKIGIMGTSTDTVDAHVGSLSSTASFTYAQALYDTLMRFDHAYEPQLALAEEVTVAPDARSWTVRLREDVTFHDGRPITLDDVIFSLRRVVDPKLGASSATEVASIDPQRFRKRDRRTLEINLRYPDAGLGSGLTSPGVGILPVDYDPRRPIGSGAFKLTGFHPGQRVVFERHDGWYEAGRPYVDRLEFVVFDDPTALLNALTSGAIDGSGGIVSEQVALAKGNPRLRVVRSRTGTHEQIVMRCDEGVFADVRMREAMKLLVDREQLVQVVYGGFGRVGNDIGSPLDPLYASDIPQRQQDLERARSLVRAAGFEGTRLTFHTTPATPSLVKAAEVVAEQAKGAGLDLRIDVVGDVGQYYAKRWGATDLHHDYLLTGTLWSTIAYAMLPDAPYNPAHWSNPRATRLFGEARATTDEARQKELLGEAQRLFWEDGGWVLWGFTDTHDALSTRFAGLVQDSSGSGINGGRFHEIGLTS